MKFEMKLPMFINGEFVNSSDNSWLDVYNPSTGELLTKVPQSTQKDIDYAVSSAEKAFEKYQYTSFEQRIEILNNIADIIDKNREILAKLESVDTGKPIRDTFNIDIPLAADNFRYFASSIRMQEGRVKLFENEIISINIYEPLGVICQIVPWNFPFLIGCWKLAPAIAAGNTSVFKPSSSTPLSMILLMDLIKDVIPKGLINVVTGSGSRAGRYLQNNKRINKFSFTGSVGIGKEISVSAAENIIPSTLELGGKSANIIFSDCNKKLAIEGIKMGILFNQGQFCAAGSRIFIEDKFYDEFISILVDEFKKVKIGNPLDFETQMGPLTTHEQLEEVLEYIEIGKKEGARLLTGGKRIYSKNFSKGCYIEPTLFEGENYMRISQEEIFGPVAVVMRFKDEEEVIKLANDSIFGLGGGIFTKDMNRAIKISKKIKTGRLWINTYSRFYAGAPFGGVKKSGIGREMYKSSLESHSQVKNIMINTKETSLGMYDI